MDRLATQPSAPQRARYDKLFRALVTAGVYSKLDALYVTKAEHSATALTNLIQASYGGTLAGAANPTFTADLGFTGTATGYIDTGFNPTTAVSPKFTRNNACIFAWSMSQQTSLTGAIFGALSGGAWNYIYPRITAGTADMRLNGLGTGLEENRDGTGFRLGSRVAASGAGAYTSYFNGSTVGTETSASSAPQNANFCLLRNASDFFNGGIVAATGFGQGLNSTEQGALFNALNEFMYDGYDIVVLLGSPISIRAARSTRALIYKALQEFL